MEEDDDRSLELQSLFDQEETKDNDEYEPVNYLDKLKGFASAWLWVAMVTVSATCCQLLERRIPDFELNTIRVFTAWILMIIVLLVKRRIPKTETFKMPYLFLHSFFASGISVPLYIAVTLTSVTTAQCIFMTSGITSGLFIFLLIVKEKITIKRVLCAILCITGVILVVQPEFLFSDAEQTRNMTGLVQSENHLREEGLRENVQHGDDTFSLLSPTLTVLSFVLPVLSGISLSSQTVLIKKYPFIGDDVLVNGFWSLMFCVMMSAILMGIFETPVLARNWMDVLYICGHSFGYAIIWTTSVLAALYISGNTINIVFSTTAVLMLLPQYTVLSSIHPGHRNWIEVVGVVLVLLGSSLGSILELLNKQ